MITESISLMILHVTVCLLASIFGVTVRKELPVKISRDETWELPYLDEMCLC